MLVVMQERAPEADIQAVADKLKMMGFSVNRVDGVVHTVLAGVGPADGLEPADLEVLPSVKEVHLIVSPYKLANRSYRPEGTKVTVRGVEIGGNRVVVMAGPCSVESKDQINRVADIVAEGGAKGIRGGAFKPRSSPYSFQGHGEEALKMMREAADRNNLFVISEVMEISQIPLMYPYIDVYQVGARNMQNFNLLRELGKVDKPVLLKRGPASTIEELLLSSEYILAGGNMNCILCERGIRTFENYTRNTMDISAIPAIHKLSHLPMVGDPSHGTGRRDKVIPMALASVAAGADGILVEVHHDPDKAWSDAAQTIFPAQYFEMMKQIRMIAEAVGRTV